MNFSIKMGLGKKTPRNKTQNLNKQQTKHTNLPLLAPSAKIRYTMLSSIDSGDIHIIHGAVA